MKTTGLVKYAGTLVALAMSSACSAQTLPSGPGVDYQYVGKTLSINGRLVTAARLSPMPRYTILVPPQDGESRTFEYVINEYGTYAGIFDYPKSDNEIGRIGRVGGQGCTNVLYGYGKKTFWIVAGDQQITEYAVPKKPVKTLSDSVGAPSSCAMNSSGDLAVGILYGPRTGGVVIYKNASGTGTVMTTPLSTEFFDGYDSKGNLFADGFNGSNQFELVELPRGSSTFQRVKINNTVEFPGSVQWDGTYITVLDQIANRINQYTIRGTKGTLKGFVSLQGSSDCAQSWIVKGLVYCGDTGNDDGEVFKYPAGGSAIAILTGDFAEPLGVVAAKR